MGADLNGEAVDDNHGGAVSLSGDGMRLAVGAKKNDAGGASTNDNGHVRVYQWLSSSWMQLGVDIDGNAGDEAGSAVSLSKDGSRVAVGAAQASGKGKVRVYQYDSGWTKLGVDIEGEATEDMFGYTVALSGLGTRLAVGAPNNDPSGSNFIGHVRVFEWNVESGASGAWNQMGIDIDGIADGDSFGWSVSLSDDGARLAVGAIEDMGTNLKGHVRVYEWNATTNAWVQIGSKLEGDATEDVFGNSVSLSADGAHVAIGAYGHDGADEVTDIGHVKVFQYNETSQDWNQLGDDIDGDEQNDISGSAVSLSADGTRVVIGASGSKNADGADADTGRINVWQYNSTQWLLVGSAQYGDAAGDKAGVSVSISDDGERVAVGSSENEDGAGRVWAYSLVANPPPPPPPSPPPSPPPPPPPSPPPPSPPPPSPPPPSPLPPSSPPPSPPPSPSPAPPTNPTSPPPPPPYPPGDVNLDDMKAQLVMKKAQA